jgi:hypothetical protein
MVDASSSFYARNVLELALGAVRDMRAPPADRAHAAFTVRFYASVAEFGGRVSDDGPHAARSMEPGSYAPPGSSFDDAIDTLDRAIADTPDEATRVVLAGWLVGLG